MAPWKGNLLKTSSEGGRVSRCTCQACAQVRVRVSLAALGPGRGPAQAPAELQAHARWWWAFPGGFNQGAPPPTSTSRQGPLLSGGSRVCSLPNPCRSPTPGTELQAHAHPPSSCPAPRILAALVAAARSLSPPLSPPRLHSTAPAQPSCRQPRGCWNWALTTSAPSAHSSHWVGL